MRGRAIGRGIMPKLENLQGHLVDRATAEARHEVKTGAMVKMPQEAEKERLTI